MISTSMPAVRAAGDTAAADMAVKLVMGVIEETWHVNQPDAQRAALRVNGELVAALSPTDPHWLQAMYQQADLLDTVAIIEFQENVRAGKPETNAALSDSQKKFLTTLSAIITADAKQTPAALQKLAHLLEPWLREP